MSVKYNIILDTLCNLQVKISPTSRISIGRQSYGYKFPKEMMMIVIILVNLFHLGPWQRPSHLVSW